MTESQHRSGSTAPVQVPMHKMALQILLPAVFLIMSPVLAMAHVYHAGNLEIQHPVIMVPSGQSDCSCAHVKITIMEHKLSISLAL
jgi:hypothetical protein